MNEYKQWGSISYHFTYFHTGTNIELVQNWQLTQNDIVFNTVKLDVFEKVTYIFTWLTNVPLSLMK